MDLDIASDKPDPFPDGSCRLRPRRVLPGLQNLYVSKMRFREIAEASHRRQAKILNDTIRIESGIHPPGDGPDHTQ